MRRAVTWIAAGVVAVPIVLALRMNRPRPTLWSGLGELPPCDGFDFPVGAPDGDGYYDAQPFGRNYHLGNDWNGNGGGDSDLGDPVYAVANGVVGHTRDHHGGWGRVLRIVHACGVESLYAHLDTLEVPVGVTVRRGQRIGTIGTAHGVYRAHLHFELRTQPLPLGGGHR
ncbi:MAG: M23 family metallopeptidase, partial [Deltaproteobacteria bacterium]|nr:M23 family metallopeptidase [Deltaproteobacteria bacterium]